MTPKKLLLISLALSASVIHGQAQAQAKVKPADNTVINERDRTNHTLTPEDQSQSKTDVVLAAKIRRAVFEQSGISVDGQNIKIIAMNNTVTLRGPVKDRTERAAIEKTVRAAAGKASVDNQLEVK